MEAAAVTATRITANAAPAMGELVQGATAAMGKTSAVEGLQAGAAAVKVAEIGTTAGEALNPISNAAEAVSGAEKAAPEAIQAAEGIEKTLAKGEAAPETAMENLLGAPESGIPPETSIMDTVSTEQRFSEVQQSVKPQIAAWEKANPPGTDIQGWIDQRLAAQRELTVNEITDRDISKWKNSPAGQQSQSETPEAYEKRLAEQKNKLRQENENQYDSMLRAQEEKRQGMSKEEFMRRYGELIRLRAAADQLAIRLNKIKTSPHLTPTRQDVINRAQAQLDDMRADIATRQAELQLDAINSRSIWKDLVIPVAVDSMMVASAIAPMTDEGI